MKTCCTRLRASLVLGFSLSFSLGLALAQPVTVLEEVVVTATRTPTTADALMQSVDVITRSDIERAAPASLMDALALLPGISVTRSGGIGKGTSVFMRGANSSHVLVLVNGMRAAPASLGEFDWNSIQPQEIERIEVVRGPLASLYGSDAIAGVIQIFTRNLTPGWQVSQSLGSNQFRSSQARAAGGSAALRWGLRADSTRSDGQQMRVTDPKRYPYRSDSLGFDLEGRLGAGWKLGVGIARLDAKDFSQQSAGDAVITQDSANFTLRGELAPDFRQSFSFYTLRNQRVTANGYPPSDIRTDRRQFSSLTEWSLPAGKFTLGLDRLLDDVLNRDPSAGTVGYEQALASTGVFAQYFLKAGHNDVRLGWRQDEHNRYGTIQTYNFSAGRQIQAGLRVYASHGTAFKGPTANDLYWPRDTYVDPGDCVTYGYACFLITEGNLKLRPERSRTNEVGLQVEGPVAYRFNLFDSEVMDLIEWASSETGTGAQRTETWTPTNVGRATLRGLEASARWAAFDWQFKLSASRILARDAKNGTQLDRRPENTASLQASRRLGQHRLHLAWHLASARFEQDETRRLSGYGRFDLADTFSFGGGWSLRGKIDNVFDKRYVLATSSGVPFAVPGRQFMLTLSYAH
jgi:vitamin B12 transporter